MRDKTGRPDNILLPLRVYHDLERLSLGFEHTETWRERTGVSGVRVTTVTGNTTLTGNNDLVLVDCTGGAVYITLPLASSLPFKQFRIKKIDSTYNKVIVQPNVLDEIDYQSEWLIAFQHDCMDIVSDSATDWFMV